MSKFGINSLTQVMASELGPYGITVNAICPGWVDTGRFDLNEKIRAEQTGTTQEAQVRAGLAVQAKNNVQGRIAVSEDIAGMAAFLVSPEGVHVRGQAINVDGGELFY
jgi:NAD(P)-dependent dehydrogenase (short-subunit alcohol dehydrogenase family)